ncbi:MULTISPECIES: IS21 family transposase [unclassified Sporosarcina]|uniref:IS21 family transposase n=1 Tax=unclassified Sporosarcina TaxID=2647733 RepID=UPI00203D2588|nr:MULTISPECIES: IS21 family transposase [unclassified Sporosarcina]GKV64841.1 integrase [Sporosarcina sp. NCCP-2331]GLB54951.1 integrase [Sporosarcina sp. NCCP-2378]
MVNCRKILELYFDGISQRTISSSTGHSRNTVSDVVRRAKQHGLESLNDTTTNRWLEELLFPEKQASEKGYFPVEWEKVHKELQKKNVTLALLHHEYAVEAREGGKIPYAYRTFCEQYGKYAKKYKLTMPIRRKPGEIMEVDWAGSTLHVTDRYTGEQIPAYVFIATLPYSQFSYVEAFLDMKSPNWLSAHIRAYEYFGGVPETLVPDNLKTGVIKAHRVEPLLNEAYREMADYYRTIIVPSRVRKPKDKASVEGTVGFISRQIIASLRNCQCFHLDDLNQRIHKKLEEINEIDFQKRPGSRKKVFEEEEKSHLQPLAPTRYKLAEWKTAKVQLNYHIQVDRMYYSVPYEYVREQVDVRLSAALLEVYFKEVRIASHKRLREEVGQFSTNPDHMPDHHRSYLEHTPENNQKWAESVGPSMGRLVAHILKQNPEKKALTILSSLRNLSTKHTNDVLETATQTLLEVSTNPTIPVLKGILDRRNTKNSKSNEAVIRHENHGFTRGAKYFGGERI